MKQGCPLVFRGTHPVWPLEHVELADFDTPFLKIWGIKVTDILIVTKRTPRGGGSLEPSFLLCDLLDVSLVMSQVLVATPSVHDDTQLVSFDAQVTHAVEQALMALAADRESYAAIANYALHYGEDLSSHQGFESFLGHLQQYIVTLVYRKIITWEDTEDGEGYSSIYADLAGAQRRIADAVLADRVCCYPQLLSLSSLMALAWALVACEDLRDRKAREDDDTLISVRKEALVDDGDLKTFGDHLRARYHGEGFVEVTGKERLAVIQSEHQAKKRSPDFVALLIGAVTVQDALVNLEWHTETFATVTEAWMSLVSLAKSIEGEVKRLADVPEAAFFLDRLRPEQYHPPRRLSKRKRELSNEDVKEIEDLSPSKKRA